MLQHALLTPDSPLEKTPHKAGNGELPITCRNRHCPKCQAMARAKWLAEREAELLPVPYFHVVFTLPDKIGRLALQNAEEIDRSSSVRRLKRCSPSPPIPGASAPTSAFWRFCTPGDRVFTCILILIA